MWVDVGRLHANTVPLYIKDLSMHRFWYARRILEAIPIDTEGPLYNCRMGLFLLFIPSIMAFGLCSVCVLNGSSHPGKQYRRVVEIRAGILNKEHGQRFYIPFTPRLPGYLTMSRDIFQRRQWQPTPVLLPGKSHGQRSLVGCSPWGREESDKTERLPFTFHFLALEKEMATHSSILAWRIPGTGEPGGLLSVGWHRVGHD